MSFHLLSHFPRLVGWERKTTASDRQTHRHFVILHIDIVCFGGCVFPLLVDVPVGMFVDVLVGLFIYVLMGMFVDVMMGLLVDVLVGVPLIFLLIYDLSSTHLMSIFGMVPLFMHCSNVKFWNHFSICQFVVFISIISYLSKLC